MAVSREILIRCITDEDDGNSLIEILKQQESKSQQINFAEAFSELNRQQKNGVFLRLSSIVDALLASCCKETGESKQADCAVLLNVVSILNVFVEMNADTPADSILLIVQSLHGSLLEFPKDNKTLKNRICQLCEHWWLQNLENKSTVISNCLTVLLERSTNIKNDVKRVWLLKDCIIELWRHDKIRSLLIACAVSSTYLKLTEGRRFIAFVFNLDADFVEEIHEEIKVKLLRCDRSEASHYGEVYFRAWLSSSDTVKEQLEKNCIQDFIFHAVRASSKQLFELIYKLLDYIHSQKNNGQVGEMLFRLYRPILWRSLKVANPLVRHNASLLFFSLFPLEDPAFNTVDADREIQKQLDLMKELLFDPYPEIRVHSIQGVCKVCDAYWDMIPPSVIKSLLMHLVEDLAFDASSVSVRMAVFKGFSILIQNPFSHPFLKAILLKVAKCFHDVSDSVRLCYLEMLLKLKGLKTIKFWEITPVEELLERLKHDTAPICRRIMSLLVKGFHPISQGDNELLERSIELISMDRAASRFFYFYIHEFLDLGDIVHYMILVCCCIWTCANTEIKTAVRNGFLEEPWKDHNEDDSSEDECNLAFETNFSLPEDIVCGLLDAVCILWVRIRPLLSQKECVKYHKQLTSKFFNALSKLHQVYRGTSVEPSLMFLASFLPSCLVSHSSSYCMSRLRSPASDCSMEYNATLLTCVCNWGRAGDILELIVDWLKSVLCDELNSSDAAKIMKNGKTVRFQELSLPQPKLALDYLMWMLQDSYCQNILLATERASLIEIMTLLKKAKKILEQYICNDGAACCRNEELVTTSFLFFCKLVLLLHDEEKHPPLNGICVLSSILTWVENHIFPKFVSLLKNESCVRTRKRSHTRKRNSHCATNVLLASKVVQDSLGSASSALMVGVVNMNLAGQIVNYCGNILSSGELTKWNGGHEIISSVLLIIHQLQQYCLVTANTQIMLKVTIPTLTNALIKFLVAYLEEFPQDKVKLIQSTKLSLLGVLTAYQEYVSKDCSALRDIVSTVLATILSDITIHLEKATFVFDETTKMDNLPAASFVLLTIFTSRVSVSRYFVNEMVCFIKSRVINDLFGLSALSVILLLLRKCKIPPLVMKENVLALEDLVQTCTRRHINDSTNTEENEILQRITDVLTTVKKF